MSERQTAREQERGNDGNEKRSEGKKNERDKRRGVMTKNEKPKVGTPS